MKKESKKSICYQAPEVETMHLEMEDTISTSITMNSNIYDDLGYEDLSW